MAIFSLKLMSSFFSNKYKTLYNVAIIRKNKYLEKLKVVPLALGFIRLVYFCEVAPC